MDLLNSFGIKTPSERTLQRHAKVAVSNFIEFGINPAAFQNAKQYYRSIRYDGYFIL